MSELAALISSFVLWQHFCAGSSLFLVLLKVFSPIPHEQVDIPMKNAEISASAAGAGHQAGFCLVFSIKESNSFLWEGTSGGFLV